MGLPEEYMASGDEHICTDLLFSFQHNIQMLDDGDLLFFDNGRFNEPELSRCAEIEIDELNQMVNTIWIGRYHEDATNPHTHFWKNS